MGSVDPPVIWRTKLRSQLPGVDHAKQFAYCVDGGRVGIGWRVEGLPTGASLAEVVSAIRATELRGWGSQAASTVRLFGEEAAVGDFVWTRDLEGRFRLGQITGGYRYENSAKAQAVDTHQVRKADWAAQPLGDHEVPAAIVRAFTGPATSFSRIRDPGARLYSAWLWEKLHGHPLPSLDLSLVDVLQQPQAVPAPSPPSIRLHLESLVGRDIETITGAPNRVLRVEGERVFVRTESTRPSTGEAVQIGVIENAAERLFRDGELRINPKNVGYRSAFVGAALGSIPGVRMATRPARLLLSVDERAGKAADVVGGRDRWWTAFPAERFWIEVSGRETFGEDLRAPDDARTSHALVREVKREDLVFHYSKRSHSIIGWSEVVGNPRRIENEYRTELGGMLGFTRVDLARLRDFDSLIRETASEMSARGHDLRGFPFERSKTRPVRPLPAYLSKLPLRIVAAIPELAAAVSLSPGASLPRVPGQRREVGGVYRAANEGVTIPAITSPESEAWRAEQAAQRTERSTREHHRLQNRLERCLADHGIRTLSPQGDDVAFDLAWHTGSGFAFAEVKSLPPDHESQRLRLGLGQCLFYRHALQGRLMGSVAAYLVVPRKPDDHAWPGACADVGVSLIWPARFAELLPG